jgi:hypothetical protein
VTIGSTGSVSVSITMSSTTKKAIAKAKKLAVSITAKTTEATPQTAKAKRTFS